MKTTRPADPVVNEVRRVRAQLSAKFGHNIHAIAADIRARQKNNPHLVRARPSQRAV
jgi:hypothetical protein